MPMYMDKKAGITIVYIMLPGGVLHVLNWATTWRLTHKDNTAELKRVKKNAMDEIRQKEGTNGK